MKIYIDIDGTMIHEEIEKAGVPAVGLEEFLVALRGYETYWLTTHCMNGDPQYAQKLMKKKVSEEFYADIDRIIPTAWSILKTDALDFTSDFVWFDNVVSSGELKELNRCKENQSLLQVDLKKNPEQLLEIARDLLSNNG
jgi:hypothetical protein